MIPEKVTVISDGTFNGCTALKSVEVPKVVISIGADVFTNCTALNTIYCYEDNTYVGTYVDENLSNVEKKYIVEDDSIALTDLNTAGNSLNVQVDTTKLGGEIGTTPYLEAVKIIVDDEEKALTNHT